jgi:hypothetical protein
MLGDQGNGIFNDAIGELLRQLMLLSELSSEVTGGNGFDFCFWRLLWFPLLAINDEPDFTAFRKIRASQKTQEIGAFPHIRKSPKIRLFKPVMRR